MNILKIENITQSKCRLNSIFKIVAWLLLVFMFGVTAPQANFINLLDKKWVDFILNKRDMTFTQVCSDLIQRTGYGGSVRPESVDSCT